MFSDQDFTDLDDSYWDSSASGPENLETETLLSELGLLGDEHCLSTDLQLAAQLGKVLLERNKDLEEQVRQAQVIQYEQAREIELLTKQLDVLRNVNESRMRLYEDVDKSLQEMEKSNEQLRVDMKSDKDRVKSLQETVLELEAKIEELQTKLEIQKTAPKDKTNPQLQERRSCSVPSLPDAHEIARKIGYEYLGYGMKENLHRKMKGLTKEERDVEEMKENIRYLKKELSSEKARRKEVEQGLEEVVSENELLEQKMLRLEHDHGQLQMEIHNIQVRSAKFKEADQGSRVMKSGVDDVDIEHDDVELTGSRAKFIRLKSGGSAFGSRESLQNLGLEADENEDDDDIVPEFADLNVELSLKTPSREKAPLLGEDPEDPAVDSSVTLLTELENQYKILVDKYEAMIEAKSQRQTRDIGAGTEISGKPRGGIRPGNLAIDTKATKNFRRSGKTPASAGPCPTSFALNTAAALVASPPHQPMGAATTVLKRPAPIDWKLTSPRTPGQNPPEYKVLFKEIFETLRRSVVYEDSISPKTAAVATSP